MVERKTCETCAYFIRHYGKRKDKYYPLACGHCITPRVKRRDPDTPACGYYRESREGGE